MNIFQKDFESIVLLEKNQPIFECKSEDDFQKFAFFSTNSVDHTTICVMYVFQNIDGINKLSRNYIDGRACLDLQLILSTKTSLCDMFEKFDFQTKKYDVAVKNFILTGIFSDASADKLERNLMGEYLFHEHKFYYEDSTGVVHNEKLAPVGVKIFIQIADDQESLQTASVTRIIKFFSENF